MIYTIDEWLDPENKIGEDYIVFTLEDGIMESLFDNGHILYNDYAMPLTEPDYSDTDRIALRLARSGGADFLLELDLVYPESGDDTRKVLPEAVNYRLSRISDARALVKGTVYTRNFTDRQGLNHQEICVLMGREVASRILGYL